MIQSSRTAQQAADTNHRPKCEVLRHWASLGPALFARRATGSSTAARREKQVRVARKEAVALRSWAAARSSLTVGVEWGKRVAGRTSRGRAEGERDPADGGERGEALAAGSGRVMEGLLRGREGALWIVRKEGTSLQKLRDGRGGLTLRVGARSI